MFMMYKRVKKVIFVGILGLKRFLLLLVVDLGVGYDYLMKR